VTQIRVRKLIEQLLDCPQDAFVSVETPDGDWKIEEDADLKVINRFWVALRAEDVS
jgi:hypothetical protein